MSAVPTEITKAIARLRSDATENLRLADELERRYTGDDPKRATMPAVEPRLGLLPDSAFVPEATVERLIEVVRHKNSRVSILARQFNVTEDRIRELVEESNGKIYIPDWRGWVKFKRK